MRLQPLAGSGMKAFRWGAGAAMRGIAIGAWSTLHRWFWPAVASSAMIISATAYCLTVVLRAFGRRP